MAASGWDVWDDGYDDVAAWATYIKVSVKEEVHEYKEGDS